MKMPMDRIFGHLIVKIYHQQHFHLCKLLKEFEITPDQYAVLAYLWNDQGLTQKELAQLAGKDQTNLTKTLDKLQALQLIERKPHPQDRRAHLIFLTEQGQTQINHIMRNAGQLQSELFTGLDPQQIDTTLRTLATILDNAEKIREREE